MNAMASAAKRFWTGGREPTLMAEGRSPWGGKPKGSGSGEDGGDGPPDDEGKSDGGRGPRNPWLPPASGPRRSAGIDEIFRAREQRRGGGGGGGGNFRRMPQPPDSKLWAPLVIGGLLVLWLGFTCLHMLGPKEQGLVTTFGSYTKTIDSGWSLTAPWPIQSVDVEDVRTINRFNIPANDGEDLVLTSDKNLVDLSYLVRWRIKNLRDYRYQLIDPTSTVSEVAQAAMRASMAEITLDQAFSGEGRAIVEQDVRQRMQRILDYYKAGILIEGVDIKKADPPNQVIGAFQEVTSAQQDAERDRSNANAWARQLLAAAEGDAASFDKVYQEYRLAPEVTKRRLYYETMERVLGNNSKVIVERGGATPIITLPNARATDEQVVTASRPQGSQQQGGGQ
jgi:modulator of FtsH protease HflK